MEIEIKKGFRSVAELLEKVYIEMLAKERYELSDEDIRKYKNSASLFAEALLPLRGRMDPGTIYELRRRFLTINTALTRLELYRETGDEQLRENYL